MHLCVAGLASADRQACSLWHRLLRALARDTGTPTTSAMVALGNAAVATSEFGFVSVDAPYAGMVSGMTTRPPLVVTVAVLMEQCTVAADVAFLLDGSASMNASTFERSLDFVAGVAEHFQLGPDLTQLAMLTFSGYFEFANQASQRDPRTSHLRHCCWYLIHRHHHHHHHTLPHLRHCC
jgi:hypothetical protein